MKAMILAAGRGERMRPLTDTTPKPLLEVNGKALIDHHLEALAAAGIGEVVINLHHLGDDIEAHVGSGERFGITIRYSRETERLETAGGIKRAMPMLGTRPFIVVSGDVFTDFDFSALDPALAGRQAHLVMVDNPAHHAGGDFALAADGRLIAGSGALTYAGIGVYAPEFFDAVDPSGPIKLRVLLDAGIERGTMTGEYFGGRWSDVGTPQRLDELNSR